MSAGDLLVVRIHKTGANLCTPQMANSRSSFDQWELAEPGPGRPSPCVTLGNCYDLLKGASFEDLARSLGPKFVLVDLVG